MHTRTLLYVLTNAQKHAGKNKKTKKKSPAKIDLVGRRVIMSADMFGGSANQCYHGVVVHKCKYRQGGKTRNGFKVRWHNGDEDFW